MIHESHETVKLYKLRNLNLSGFTNKLTRGLFKNSEFLYETASFSKNPTEILRDTERDFETLNG